ncbi:hypothetical protein [Chitinophaga sp. XS-30]|uniref:hypothetical protein n=1 Tax=Chitinophaga sp. XS-30 TaxID=2604421 RepID=UPI0011DD65CB|nr:hypothetical protein [Chitinophaga sp. XS-30]QEH39952.1 hypothetical protein FW415_03355 [Chitinophaga sp. XS-30]
MKLNRICSNIDKIDLNNPEDLKAILFQDKHTRIEGLCSEVAFMEDVVYANLSPFTSDFWFSGAGRGYHVRKILTDEAISLSNLDYTILDIFASMDSCLATSIVYFNKTSRAFYQFEHKEKKRYLKLEDYGCKLDPVANSALSNITGRDETRIAKACAYLEKRGLLRDAAIKRLFANNWLREFAWDIDVFTVTDEGRITAIEVKQKYPTKRNTFGINDGQLALFDFLTKKGIPVIHVILRKPEDNPDLHAVDLLTIPEFIQKTQLLFMRFSRKGLVSAVQKAPQSTSIFGKRKVAYTHIPVRQFIFLKMLGVPVANVREKLFSGLEPL